MNENYYVYALKDPRDNQIFMLEKEYIVEC